MRRVVGKRRELSPPGRAFDENCSAVIDPSEPVTHRYPNRIQLEGLQHDTHPAWASLR